MMNLEKLELNKIVNEFYVTDNKYLANALSFIGFRFYIYGEGNQVKYSFKNSVELRNSVEELYELKRKLYYK